MSTSFKEKLIALEKEPFKEPSLDHLSLEKLTSVWRPDGYLLLHEIISLIGQARYKREWTHKEFEPSRLPPSFNPDKTYISPINPSSLQTSRQPYARVLTLSGWQVVPNKKSAENLWKKSKPLLLKAHEQEKQAATRVSDIKKQLRQALSSRQIKAKWLDRETAKKISVIKPAFWQTKRADNVFDFHHNPYGNIDMSEISLGEFSGGSSPKEARGFVVFEKGSVENFLVIREQVSDKPDNDTVYRIAYKLVGDCKNPIKILNLKSFIVAMTDRLKKEGYSRLTKHLAEKIWYKDKKFMKATKEIRATRGQRGRSFQKTSPK